MTDNTSDREPADEPARNNEKKTRGRPFGPDHPGMRFQPGNPGRPKGSRHKSTLAIHALLDGEAESITRKAIELAKAGDMTAIRLCLERLAPPPKDAPVRFALPSIENVGDLPAAQLAVLHATASGDITPSEGAAIAEMIDRFRRSVETDDLAARIAALEETKIG